MTTHRAAVATAARVRQRIACGAQLDALLATGMWLKAAAHAVGWSHRSACRWRTRDAGKRP